MRAINLVPADARPGRVSGGKSGGAVYGVLGVLIVLILAASTLAISKRNESRAQQQLSSIQQSTQAYTRIASQYSSFESAAKQATERINTVRALADARFDWAGALRDLSRLIPESANISSLGASVDPTASSGDGGGSGASLRGALPVPAITMTGCTLTQSTAANLVTQLQAMRRVTNVTLESSEKAKQDDATADSPFEQTGCSGYTYSIVVFFAPGSARASTAEAPSSTTTVSTESAGGTTPPASNTGSN